MVILTTLLFMTCPPEDERDGVDEADGTGGADEEQGEHGETVTTNVIYSDWIYSELDDNVISSSTSFSLDVPLMTQEIIDAGVVLVFGKSKPAPVTNDTYVFGLPLVFGSALQQSHCFKMETAEQLDIVMVANKEGESVGTPFFWRVISIFLFLADNLQTVIADLVISLLKIPKWTMPPCPIKRLPKYSRFWISTNSPV